MRYTGLWLGCLATKPKQHSLTRSKSSPSQRKRKDGGTSQLEPFARMHACVEESIVGALTHAERPAGNAGQATEGCGCNGVGTVPSSCFSGLW